jgi:hypothetical protein
MGQRCTECVLIGEPMSAQVAPETIHNELLRELSFLYRGEGVNDFALRSLRKRAETLASADPGGSLEVRGHVQLLSGDLPGGRELLDRAMALSRHKNRLFIRYMQALEQTGHLSQVYEVFGEYRQVLTGVADATRQAMNTLAAHGYLDVAQELRSDLERMNVPVGEVIYTPGEQLLAYSDREGMSDADTSPVVRFVREFLYSKGVKTTEVSLVSVTGEGDGPAAVLYELTIATTPEHAAELEWELYGLLEFQEFRVEAERRLLFSLTSSSVGH